MERPGVSSDRLSKRGLVLLVSLEDDVPKPVFGRSVGRRPQQCEAAALAVHPVLSRRKRDVSPAIPALLQREADQLQALQRPAREVQVSIHYQHSGLILA